VEKFMTLGFKDDTKDNCSCHNPSFFCLRDWHQFFKLLDWQKKKCKRAMQLRMPQFLLAREMHLYAPCYSQKSWEFEPPTSSRIIIMRRISRKRGWRPEGKRSQKLVFWIKPEWEHNWRKHVWLVYGSFSFASSWSVNVLNSLLSWQLLNPEQELL
jgi:hypothetical protein